MTELAFEILRPLKQNGGDKPIVQICGPMTTGGVGTVEGNMRIFELAIERAHNSGILVFNQLPFEITIKKLAKKRGPKDGYFTDILDLFYKPVLTSGFIDTTVFLPTWRTSNGANWERELSTSHGLRIGEYCPEMFKSVMTQYYNEKLAASAE